MFRNLFDFSPEYLLELLICVPIVLFSLSVHECAHGFIAYKFGDPTARNLGRLTLNPIKHLDIIGALCMLLFGFGWAKPVPINTRYFKKPKLGMAISALAGPASNLIVAFIAYAIYRHLDVIFDLVLKNGANISERGLYVLTVVYLFFTLLCSLNISLAVFNLIPIPPLDGSRILFVLLPDKIYFGVMKYERYIGLGLFLLLSSGLLDVPMSAVFSFFVFIFEAIVQILPYL